MSGRVTYDAVVLLISLNVNPGCTCYLVLPDRILTSSLPQKLKEIGTNPSSPKALGDLLMNWVCVSVVLWLLRLSGI